jgi:lipopolysaccharide transport system ATP-binding protein
MSAISIQCEGLGKCYRIGKVRSVRYETLRDRVAQSVAAPFTRLARRWTGSADANPSEELMWALREASFAIASGERVGIIGRNGAGKSTLLKILSRITEPSAGYAEVRGRVSSLLEVGTGFHPELTGRENILLNGAILGMRSREIRRKFDEIVAFAEVEKFIDTAVKHYSSGMQMRLAFAVAAHLEPEILLIDEVLAVGDAAFQRKCLNKMEGVGAGGRIVLFVSHNMPAITRLCERTILLDSGRILHDGPSHQVVSTYLHSGLGSMAAREWADIRQAPGNDVVRLRAVRVRAEDGRVSAAVDIRQSVGVEIEFEVLRPGYALWPHYTLDNDEGVRVFLSFDQDPEWRGRPRPVGRYVSTSWIPGNMLAEGTMIIGASVRTEQPRIVHFYERDAAAFQVIDSLEGNSARGDYLGAMPGIVRPLLKWTTRYEPDGRLGLRATPVPQL